MTLRELIEDYISSLKQDAEVSRSLADRSSSRSCKGAVYGAEATMADVTAGELRAKLDSADADAESDDAAKIAGYIKTLNQIDAASRAAGSPPPLGIEGLCVYSVRQMRERLNAIEKLLPYLDDGCNCSHNKDDGIEGKCVACQARELLKDKRWRLF